MFLFGVLQAEAESFDFILDTAPATIPLDPYIILLKQKGVLVIVGSASELKFSPHLIFRSMFLTHCSEPLMINFSYL